MYVKLSYTRGEKPRGGWCYPLEAGLFVDYSDAEIAALAPDWRAEVIVELPAMREGPRRTSAAFGGTVYVGQLRLEGVVEVYRHDTPWTARAVVTPTCTASGGTLYFDAPAAREQFIVALHAARDATLAAATAWWHASAADAGSPECVDVRWWDDSAGSFAEHGALRAAAPNARRIRREGVAVS